MKKIILVGYMGSGKSTIGLNLAKQISIPFFDMDVIIEKNVGLDIASIFQEKGELFFRKKEHEILHHFLHNTPEFVLALGGGTPCYYDNYKLYQNGFSSFYLKSSVNELVRRLQFEIAHRPLLANKSIEELEDYVAKHLFERSFFYHQVNHIVSVDNKSINDLLDEIAKKLT